MADHRPDSQSPEHPADHRRAFQHASAIAPGMPGLADPGNELGATIRDDDGSSTRQDGAPTSSSSARLQTILLEKVRLSAPGNQAGSRYSINGVVGQGATSQVFDALDHTFGRHIAIKYLHGEKAVDAKRIVRFMKEAKVTARLEHPNIAPIHDMDFTADGGIYFTMRMITGTSLGDAVRAAQAGQHAPQIASIYQRVSVFQRVAEAVACAHAQRIIHRDIKPDNIMLGAFGEVVLVDWGSALVLDEDGPRSDRVVGTPNYMSAEQARMEPVDERSDIHCLGASLFEVLTLRLPLTGRDAADFWDKKRNGHCDPPTPEETARIPKRLLAIAMKAMAAQPTQRYATVQEFADDLARYQAGLAISAYRDSALERLSRWHRLHARAVWGVAAMLAVVICAGVVLYGERLKEIASWGRPISHDTFATDTRWQREWGVVDGSFAVRDGMLVTTAPGSSRCYYRHRLDGSIAIEYDGRMLPDSPPCDLSVNFSTEDPFSADAPTWFMQIGAYDNSYVQILDASRGLRCDLDLLQLEPDRTYRIRVEIDGDAIRILVDGRLICEHHEPVPFTSGWIGLYGYYPGKSFDNVRIYSKGIPEKVSALAVGDGDISDGLFDRAVTQYRRVERAHTGKAIGEEAAYKIGLAYRLAGRGGDAYAAWQHLSDNRWRGMVAFHRLEDRLALRDYAAVARGVGDLYTAHRELRQRLRNLWVRAVDSALTQASTVGADFELLLSIRERHFADEAKADEAAARLLRELGRYDELLARFPDQIVVGGEVLRDLGRQEEVLARYPGRRIHVAWSLLEMGRFDEALAIQPPIGWVHAGIPGMIGEPERWDDPEAVLTDPQTNIDDRFAALALLDRPEIGASIYGAGMRAVIPTLQSLHAWDLAVSLSPRDRPLCAVIDIHRALVALDEGRDAEAAGILATVDTGPAWFRESKLWFAYLLARPFVAAAHGDRAPFAQALDEVSTRGRLWFEQRPWYFAQYISGRMDDASFLAQPCRGTAPAMLAMAKALRADWQGDHAEAVRAYGAYLALPANRRAFYCPIRDPSAETFAAWRMRALQGR
ncbi:MAG: protein kinase [Planctomycetes bacterium]|nr:protein kinase [Planctomycetota bacterium]